MIIMPTTKLAFAAEVGLGYCKSKQRSMVAVKKTFTYLAK